MLLPWKVQDIALLRCGQASIYIFEAQRKQNCLGQIYLIHFISPIQLKFFKAGINI